MNSTSTLISNSVEDLSKVVNSWLEIFSEVYKQLAISLWSSVLSILSEYWLFFMTVFFIILLIVSLKAMLGRWGSLGSFLYNFFYFGILFLICLILGPEIFVKNYFNTFCAIILYPVCYRLVGIILERLGLIRHR